MAQKTAPFLEGKYGWNLGESGWNSGMDENLVKFSYLFDKNVDGIVSSLPAPVNGEAYFNTTDNRIYYVVDGTYSSTPVPQWFVFQLKATGETYIFNGSSAEAIPTTSSLDTRVTAVEDTVSTLGTAAFEDATNFTLSSELADSSDLTKGASLVGGLLRVITSIAQLQTYEGRYEGDQIYLLGYYSDTPGYGGGVWRWSSTSGLTPNGGTVIQPNSLPVGRWIRQAAETTSVYDWGARQGTEASDAIQAAFDWVRARGYGTVDLGNSSFFLTNKPIRGCANSRLTGKSILRAQSPFSGVVFDVFSGGTDTVSTMIYYADAAPTSPSGTVATIGNPTGSRRQNIVIDDGVTLDCDDIAGYGVFMDNYQYYRLNPRVIDAVKWGIRCYFYCWTGSIGAYITGSAEGGLWLGPASNGINLAGLLAWGETKTSSVAGVLIDGDNNGIQLDGATIERCYDGVLARNGCGPVDISGCDFEQIQRHVLFLDGTTVPARVNGPVTVSGCFLETVSATDALIKVINGDVTVKDCRARNAAKFVDQTSSGQVNLENNVEVNITSVGNGNIKRIRRNSRALSTENYSPVSTTLANVREDWQYAYPYAALPSGGVTFASQVTSGANRTMIGTAEIWTANFNLDVETGRMGFKLNFTTGTKNIEPLTTGDHNLGTSALKFNRIVGNSHVQAAGVGVSVTPQNNGEMVMEFTSNTQVTIRGRGTDGVTRVATITLA